VTQARPRPPPQADPFAEKIEYRDNLIEQQVIRFVCRQTQAILHGQRRERAQSSAPRAPIGA
jgi:hypothetical protein